MSSPAASASVAILVLAWDETTPAVRALVEATEIAEPVLDSVLVLVPAGSASEDLTPEVFSPLVTSTLTNVLPDLPAAPDELAATARLLAASEEATVSAAESIGVLAALPPVADGIAAAPATALPTSGAESNALPPVDTTPNLGLVGLNAPTVAAPDGPVVRIVRLSEHSLSELAAYAQQALPAPVWLGPTSTPAAPYLGSSLAAPTLPISSIAVISEAAPTALSTAKVFTYSALLVGQSRAFALSEAPSAPDYLSAALAADPNTIPTPAHPEAVLTDSASSTELSEAAADELATPFSVNVTPVQAGWSEALSSLQKPARIAEGPAAVSLALASDSSAGPAAPTSSVSAAPAARPAHAALLPTASQFNAPDLNFQVIQYARFAVPLALAAQPFAVIYAPAWPTWLAAQELRHRTGQPLVLHVATLAAGDEPIDLAAGWPAEIQRQALHRADLILTETPALAHRLRRELNLPAHRVCPVPAADAAAVAQALSTAQVWPASA